MQKIRDKISKDLGPLPLLMTIGAGVVTIVPFFGESFWLFDLFAHFRVQYCLILFVGSILLSLLHRYKTASVCGGCMVLNLMTILPLYSGSVAEAGEHETMRVMLINVNTRGGDVVQVGKEVERVDADILVLEEVSSEWLVGLKEATERYPYRKVEPRSDNFGISLFSKFPILSAEIAHPGKIRTPVIIATLDTGRGPLKVVATHPVPPAGAAMSSERNEMLRLLPGYTQGTEPVLLIGDLNTTPWSPHFKRLMSESGLKDSARGFGVQPTWPEDNLLLRIPIDHCLYSEGLGIVNREIGHPVGSDHFPLILDFNF